MRRFLKENLTLVTGLVLPTFLIFIFYLATVIPKMLVTPPQYDLLYLTTPYPHDGITTEVQKGILKIWITPQVRKGSLPMPKLFRFNAKTQTSTEIPLTLSTNPGIITSNKKEELLIPTIKDLKLDTTAIGPDGYKAEITAPDTGSITNLFLMNTKRILVISKSGNVINVSHDQNKNGNNTDGYKSIKFLGWITSP